MERPPIDRNQPEWLFRELNQAHRAAVDAVFARLGIREFGQPHLLFVLDHEAERGHTPTQRELADNLKLSPATITNSLKSLERLGCVRKIADAEDMRKNRIEITKKGREISQKCRKAFRDVDRAMYSDFDESEREQIARLYVRMAGNLRALARAVETEREEETAE